MDKDGQPPRKKVSRFFAGGKSLFGNLPGKARRTGDDGDRLNLLTKNQTVIALSHRSATGAGTAEDFEHVTPNTATEPAAPSRNRFSQSASASRNSNVRDRRRDGIVGTESLLRSTTGIRSPVPGTTLDNSDIVIIQPTNPLENDHFRSQPVPIANHCEQSTMKGLIRHQARQEPLTLQQEQQSNTRSKQAGLMQRLETPQSPPAHPTQETRSLASASLQQQPNLQMQEECGPLNGHVPRVESSKIPLNDRGFQQPFLPRPNAGIDLDRDVSGKKLPPQVLRPIANLPNKGITKLPQHATLTPKCRPILPPTYYTSPDRIQHAITTSRSRKRKRTTLIPPPPAFIWQHTGDPSFNIFSGILLYPELVFHLASILPLRDLINLYAICRDFHIIIDTRFTTVVLSQSLRKAPECSRAFPFRCYAHLCRTDPAPRIPHPNPQAAAAGRVRLIPSFRWLAFILHREKVVHELMALFAEDGVPLPKRCSLAIKRMWFILDIPDNARRIGYIHNVNLFTDLDLYFGMCFFVKLDMRLNDPVGLEKRDGMRRMLLSQESFTTVLKVLRRDEWQKQIDVMRAWVRYKYSPLPDEAGVSIFGVPAEQIGTLRWEYWGKIANPHSVKKSPQLLLRPDQLVIREAIKRGLRFHKHYLRCLTYGYVRMDTLEDYEPRKMSRRKESLKDEYGLDDEIGGLTLSMKKAGLEDGQDGDMLDLGECKDISLLCIEGGNKSLISEEDQLKMEEEGRFLEACLLWSEKLEEDDVDERMLMN